MRIVGSERREMHEKAITSVLLGMATSDRTEILALFGWNTYVAFGRQLWFNRLVSLHSGAGVSIACLKCSMAVGPA